MSLDSETRDRLESIVGSDRVVLFMKGTREQPQCGFSAATIGILDALVPSYTTVNVLEDQGIREGVKTFSDWPTIPQLYIDNEFMGGCDVVKQMFNTGALHEALSLDPPDRTPPEVELSPAVAEMVSNALAEQPGLAVHLSINARWEHNFQLGPAEGHEVVSESNGVTVHMDLATAAKARGLRVDLKETLEGTAFHVDNPNAPPPVNQLTPPELKSKLDAAEALHLYDVREPAERERARIEGSRLLDEAAVAEIDALPKDAQLVFHCHHGPRSQQAADYFRLRGHTNVHNLMGGIDAWSQQVDPQVERY